MNRIEQCCAAHIVQGCQQWLKTLLHAIQPQQYCSTLLTTVNNMGSTTTELYYISGYRALIPRQSKKCPQEHGGFWPKIRHFDVIIIPIFMVQTTDTQNCSATRRK